MGFVWLAGASLCMAGPSLAQFTFPPFTPARTSASACIALNALVLPELAAIAAEWLDREPPRSATTGSGKSTALPAHCRVSASVAPAIQIEVWLPAAEAWNGRFLALGGSGAGGSLNYGDMAAALNAGYATASTDSGHRADDYTWLADVALVRDFAYRAIYEMTTQSRAILSNFYGRPADYRYFNGCALGGRQGLMEAERFPEDYDGIVAGSPGLAFVDAGITQLWSQAAAHPVEGLAALRPELLAMVNAEVLAQCDTLDGAADGVLEDPRRCAFEPGRLQCGSAAGGRCLTATEVTALRQIYSGPPEPEGPDPGLPGLALGSERGWTFVATPDLEPLTLELFRRAVFADPDWSSRSFDFVVDIPLARAAAGWLDATATDLTSFRNRGGRLIVYQGWNDVDRPPEATIDWYEAVEGALPPDAGGPAGGMGQFARLFMVPGMAECGGNEATNFDLQRSIEAWVEQGTAPDRIESEVRVDGETVRTRPLCPYPQVARYRGGGSSDRSGSFVCAI
jgi:feruloyl esterase